MNKLIFGILALTHFTVHAQSANLRSAYNCITTIRSQTDLAGSGDAVLIKINAGAVILNAAQILQVTEPSPERIPIKAVTMVQPGGARSQALITAKMTVTFLAGNSESNPKIYVRQKPADEDLLKRLVDTELRQGLERKSPARTGIDRIKRNCRAYFNDDHFARLDKVIPPEKRQHAETQHADAWLPEAAR